jgi:hypothetical protein
MSFRPWKKSAFQEQIEAILDGRGAELRLEITVLDNLITTLETLPTTPVEMRLGG